MAVKNGMKSKRISGISSVVYFVAALLTLLGGCSPCQPPWKISRTGFMKQNIMQKHFLLLGGRKENLKEKLCIMGLKT